MAPKNGGRTPQNAAVKPQNNAMKAAAEGACAARRSFETATWAGIRAKLRDKWTCKPNSVLRSRGVTIIPLGPASLPGSCDLPEGSNAPSRCVSAEADSLPIVPCSVCGLPSPGHRCQGGALFPLLFPLPYPESREAVYFLGNRASSSFE